MSRILIKDKKRYYRIKGNKRRKRKLFRLNITFYETDHSSVSKCLRDWVNIISCEKGPTPSIIFISGIEEETCCDATEPITIEYKYTQGDNNDSTS
jgi:hypothetical protein